MMTVPLPLKVSLEVELLCVTVVTFVPMAPLISTLPFPVPELVIVPTLFTPLELDFIQNQAA
jgi:hypothetical protein